VSKQYINVESGELFRNSIDEGPQLVVRVGGERLFVRISGKQAKTFEKATKLLDARARIATMLAIVWAEDGIPTSQIEVDTSAEIMLSYSKVRKAAIEADDETFKRVLADAVHNHKFSQAPQFQIVAHIDLGGDDN
jgi:hypothetical protein